MISCEVITKKFDEYFALKDLSIDFCAGKVVTLFGPSGCGKTTLLRIIAGLDVPDVGVVTISNKIVTQANKIIVPPQKRKVSFVFQSLALWPHMSAIENIKFCINKKINNSIEVERKSFDVLEQVDLLGKMHNLTSELSGGEKKRVAIARCLVSDPKILLIDEPFTNLDAALKAKMIDLILNAKYRNNATLILATHDIEVAREISDEIVFMKDGSVVNKESESLRSIL